MFLGSLLAQGSRGLFETTEGRYGEVAREMRLSKDYMTPTLDGNPHWTKPPVTYWVMAGGMSLLGENAWGVRLGGALATALGAAMLGAVAGELWNRKTAIWTVLIWATGFLPAAGASTASTDIYLAAAETIAVGAFLIGWKRSEFGWYTLMWTAFGIAFLTKGPPGLLPLGAIILFAWRGGFLRKIFPLPGILLFFLTGFSWYVAVVIKNPDLLQYFMGEEVVNRIASKGGHNSEWYAPFTLYLPVLIFSLGAWGILALFERLRTGWWGPLKKHWGENSEILFLMLWICVPLLMFTLARSRLPLYLLPLCAPLSLLAARQLSQAHGTRLLTGLALASTFLVVGGKYLSAQLPIKNNMEQLAALVESALETKNPNLQLVIYRQTRMFGLQFYLHRTLYRLTDTSQSTDYPVVIYDFHQFLKAHPRKLICVTRLKDIPDLEAKAADAGWKFEEISHSKHWSTGQLLPNPVPASLSYQR
ncbi:MAG: ArnT family glycosyltransferase [Oceanipulchritudo sp.]